MTRLLPRLALALFAVALAVPATAPAATISGDPLLITAGDDDGRLGVAFRGSNSGEFCCGNVSDGIPNPANAGFVVTLPGSPFGPFGSRAGRVDVVAPPIVTGTGVASDPFKLKATYQAVVDGTPRFHIVQELTYVNGSVEVGVRNDVVNITGDPLAFRASIGADLYGGGDDSGVGLLLPGPPRAVGGTNPSSGAVAALVESTAWSHFEEGNFASVLGRAQSDPSDTSNNQLLDKVEPERVDNGAAVQWDQYVGTALPGNSSAGFDVRWRFTRAFDLSPDTVPNATTGVPVQLATQVAASDTGRPRSGVKVRYAITGSNAMTGDVTTGADGRATIEYVPAIPGQDTVTAFPDLNGNGQKDAEEPQQETTVFSSGPQPPVFGQSANVAPLEGTVKIKLPKKLPPGFKAKTAWVKAAQSRFAVLTSAQQIPVGSTMDVSRGRLQLASAANKGATTSSSIQSSSFSPCPANSLVVSKGCQNTQTLKLTRFSSSQSSSFIISQSTRERGLTEVSMAGAISCSSRSKVIGAARKRSRALWGNGKGKFRTRGRSSSATVRGTEWYSKDTCSGTETRVTRGTVVVRDFGKGKNVTVKAGKKYFARYKKGKTK